MRAQSERLAEPLEIEDYGVQPMDNASPPKWHLAHTSWFFETFLLVPYLSGYRPFHPLYEHLFNSYYNGVGEPFPRPRRGHLSRPTVSEVYEYRAHVDAAMVRLLTTLPAGSAAEEVVGRTVLGLNHEQQHQELMITDLKFNFGHNPLQPAYADGTAEAAGVTRPLGFIGHPGGLVSIGVDDQEGAGPADVVQEHVAQGGGFHFDNEAPAHRVFLAPFALADRVVTCDEYLAFIDDGGYQTPSLWLSDGWAWVNGNGIRAPLYWSQRNGEWWEYRLTGPARVGSNLPVTHVSGYEADAYARWAGCRLPSEAEWETVAKPMDIHGHFAESGLFHPLPAAGEGGRVDQLFGDVWEWTSSSYAPYPGFRSAPGTIGEYNGKFMANQLVLRGGSCATPEDHIRASYRNFFYPPDRWQFTGIRLARDGN